VLILVISLALTIAIFILLYRFYRQRQKLQKKEVAVLQQQQEVIRLRATLAGQHEERVRIAKEIHDEIGSGLTTLVFLTNAFPKTEEYKKTYDKLTGLARQMVNQMNEIVWSLNSEQDTLEDLVVYIRHSISEMANAATIHCEFSIPAAIPSWSLTGIQRRNIYLVIKEAVHNAVKHANASAIYVAMDFSEKIWFQVRDDGQGMNTEGSRFGNGLKNMQYRMQQIGGEWKLVETTPVTIEISLRVEHTL
jgi:two-component system, NarL family, sensor kinase